MNSQNSKTEAIKAAYGEHWDKLSEEAKDFVLSNDGYVSYWHWSHFNMDFDFDLKTSGLYRPKSLSGIETNNGWTRIESEEDLPKEAIECYFIAGEEIYKGWYNLISFNGRLKPNSVVINFSNDMVTHYQPIETPKPPIF
ncbi:hypothetical protein [Elizabethkingia ursingii]|uniref:hypothetical protein n=1 Tax=Elizabethkingia ursingii TaxID=1756150 RepID=UPI000750B8B4|nr:hypothetical protein [Elizabethkingia ursingii]KUY28050.1 hypothetical protein ATB96_19635 [Elizabethkingia ursingii]